MRSDGRRQCSADKARRTAPVPILSNSNIMYRNHQEHWIYKLAAVTRRPTYVMVQYRKSAIFI